MKHTVLRPEPAPVERIMLEVTPGELLGLHRALARTTNEEYKRVTPSQVNPEDRPVDVFELFRSINSAAKDAGIIR